MAEGPTSRTLAGAVVAIGTDATNEVRFEPVLNGRFLRVLAAVFDGSDKPSALHDLNPHLDYSTPTVPQETRDLAVGDPRGIDWNEAGDLVYVAGMGSNNLVVLNAAMSRVGLVEVGEGPTGVRVHDAGGFDLVTGNPILGDPANVLTANPVNIVKDTAAGLLGGSLETGFIQAPPGDGMLYWARADFVRRVSTVTFGFFDTLQPQRAELVDPNQQPIPVAGYPDWAAVNPNLRMSDVLVQIDPPQTRQPAGTGVVVELRGCETFENSEVLYNPTFGSNPDDSLARGNLLNVN